MCGMKWKNMTPEQKSPYLKLFELNREKYLRDKNNSRLNLNLSTNNLTQINNFNPGLNSNLQNNQGDNPSSNNNFSDQNNNKNVISKNNNF
jgi:hypothetical protein